METKENNQHEVNTSKVVKTVKNVALTVGVTLATIAPAFAADGDVAIDLTTAVAGVAVVGGLISAGALKAVPTYVGWGIKKALAMLR